MITLPISDLLLLPGVTFFFKKDVFPWLELSKDCFSKSHTRRIPADSDKAFDEIKFLNIVGMAVENVLMGFLPVEESLNRAQKLIDEEINK